MIKKSCVVLIVLCLCFLVGCSVLATNEEYHQKVGAYTTFISSTAIAKVTPRSVSSNMLNNNRACITLADGIPSPYYTRAWYRDGSYRQEATPNALGAHDSTIWAQYYNNFGNYGETYSLGIYNPHTEMISLSGDWTPN